MHLLKTIVIPVAFILIINSFSGLENTARIKTLGIKTLFWFLTTAIIASVIGLFVSLWIHPADGFQQNISGILNQTPSLSQLFVDMMPNNLFDQVAHGKVIPIIIAAIVFAVAMTACREETVIVKQFFEGLAKIITVITHWIICLSPIGIFIFVAEVSAQYGLTSLIHFAKIILTVAVACFLQFIVYGLLLVCVARINPIHFVRVAWPMMVTAFTTASSLGTLPLTIETLVTYLKVPKQIAVFVASLGANAKMDGCGAIYPVVICIFTASLLHIPLAFHQYILIVIVSTVATFGTAGVPSSAIVTAMIVLTTVGLPLNALMLVLGIDRILDMIRTMTNVTGQAVCSVLIAKQTKIK